MHWALTARGDKGAWGEQISTQKGKIAFWEDGPPAQFMQDLAPRTRLWVSSVNVFCLAARPHCATDWWLYSLAGLRNLMEMKPEGKTDTLRSAEHSLFYYYNKHDTFWCTLSKHWMHPSYLWLMAISTCVMEMKVKEKHYIESFTVQACCYFISSVL